MASYQAICWKLLRQMQSLKQTLANHRATSDSSLCPCSSPSDRPVASASPLQHPLSYVPLHSITAVSIWPLVDTCGHLCTLTWSFCHFITLPFMHRMTLKCPMSPSFLQNAIPLTQYYVLWHTGCGFSGLHTHAMFCIELIHYNSNHGESLGQAVDLKIYFIITRN